MGGPGLDAHLFGDILAVTRSDLVWIWGAALVGCLLVWRWQRLVTASVNENWPWPPASIRRAKG